MAKRGLYSNINDKKKRIAAGSGETMRSRGNHRCSNRSSV
jgi:hypothetical protein